MTRRTVWLCMFIGGVIYQGAKPLFGFTMNLETLGDMAYWSGVTLFVHWMGSKHERKSQERNGKPMGHKWAPKQTNSMG